MYRENMALSVQKQLNWSSRHLDVWMG